MRNPHRAPSLARRLIPFNGTNCDTANCILIEPAESEQEGRYVDDFDNPYQSPGNDEPAPLEILPDEESTFDPRTIGKAKYVPWVAILLIAHGTLMFLVAIALIGIIAFVVPNITQQIEKQQEAQRQQNPNAPQLTKEGMATMLYGMYGAVAAIVSVIGIIDIYAGIRNYGYHNRTLGIITLVLNMGAILTCWCAPLSIALMIFGLIIYLSPDTDQAFRWRAKS